MTSSAVLHNAIVVNANWVGVTKLLFHSEASLRCVNAERCGARFENMGVTLAW